jgi:hypothetical protein
MKNLSELDYSSCIYYIYNSNVKVDYLEPTFKFQYPQQRIS